MKKSNLVNITLIIILLILTIIILTTNYKNTEKKTYDTYIIVSDGIGFDINNTIISFGEIRPGGTSTRKIILESDSDKKIYVKAYAEGEIKEFIEEIREVIEPYETINISITAAVPQGAEKKTYKGKINIIMKKELF